MNRYHRLRPINLMEKGIILNSMLKLSPNLLSILSDEYCIYICFNSLWKTQKFPSIHLISQQQHIFMNSFTNLEDIYAVGVYMGFIKQGNFLVSLEFLEFLKQHDFPIILKNIVVNQNGERSILYGNDLSKEMILSISKEVKKDDNIIIFNQHNEILALAKCIINNEDISALKSHNKVAVNIIDKGYYLRKEQ